MKEKPKHPTRIAQGRDLINAAYTLKLPAKRVLLMCLAQLNASDKPDDHNGEFVLTAAQYRDLWGGDKAKTSRDMKAGVKELKSNWLKFLLNDGVYEEKEIPWLVSIEHGSAGTPAAIHRIMFNPVVMPFMRELEKGFALFNIRDCAPLSSTNQIRLYEDLALRKSFGWWNTTLDDFAARYQLSSSSLSRPSDFKRNFLDTAIEQINLNTGLKVVYSNQGREFKFTIADTKKAAKLGGAVAAAAGDDQ
ncbi:replication initiation protein [Salmonella enterica]|nr:replication initiation protein [Salmonella enterica]